MPTKGTAHKTLSHLLKRDGFPNSIIMAGSKEQTLGKSKKKANKAHIWVKQIEPYSPWSNQAEQSIREPKKSSARKILKNGIPKRLWDDCIELEAYIRYNTANSHAYLKGQTQETFLSGKTSEISEFAEFAWYDWVMYRDTSVSYPGIKPQIECYYGPAYDIGPAMCARILKGNGEYAYQSSLRGLTTHELAEPVQLRLR